MSGNIVSGMENNFRKSTAVDISSLGNPYDLRSLMHYPSWAFSKNGLDTIKPNQPLPPGVIMGQRSGMSQNDIAQLRLLYQCSTGSRNENTLTMDHLCSTECKCWEYAMGTCDSNDECMGESVCGLTPSPAELLSIGIEGDNFPERMCLPPGLTVRPTGSPSGSVMPTELPSVSMGPTISRSPTESPTDNVSD
ncbi:hypothetical protein ACHAXR_002842 [Thalassiosira sp. AJA248-18]